MSHPDRSGRIGGIWNFQHHTQLQQHALHSRAYDERDRSSGSRTRGAGIDGISERSPGYRLYSAIGRSKCICGRKAGHYG